MTEYDEAEEDGFRVAPVGGPRLPGPGEDGEERAELPLALEKVGAGFPLPNGGSVDRSLDLNEFCVSHPHTSYIFQVAGDSLTEAGVLPDDYLVVDRSLTPRSGDLVIAEIGGEFTAKFYRAKPRPILLPANPRYRPVPITPELGCEITGVVVSVFRKLRN